MYIEVTSIAGNSSYHWWYPKDYETASGAGLKLDLSGYHEVQFYFRTTCNTTNLDELRIQLYTTPNKYAYHELAMPTKFWHVEKFSIEDMTEVNTPDWTNINAIGIHLDTKATPPSTNFGMWIDGLRIIRHQILGEAEDVPSQQTYGTRPLYLVDKGFQFLGQPQAMVEQVLRELKDEQVTVRQSLPLNFEVIPGYLAETWNGTDFEALRLQKVEYNFDKGEMEILMGRKSSELKDILKSFGYDISQIGQYGGDVTGVTPTEEPVIGCGTTCELTCQSGCMSACQTECELNCQTQCEIACQTACELGCETQCMQQCQWCWEAAGGPG